LIHSDGNKILFEGSLKSDARSVLVCIYNLINKQGYKDIVLDFSSTGYVDASIMLPICSYVAYYRLNHVDFILIEPIDPTLKRLFANANWAHYIDPAKYAINNRGRSNNLPALQFLNGDAQHNVVNMAMDVMMETIKVHDRKQMKALEWALNEITDNVLNHASSPIGGLVQIQSFPARERVSFYVVDAGVGIPYTLRNAIPNITSDSDALDRAIREGVTRNKNTNQGNGLFGTFKCCEVSGGEFSIRSNNATLTYKDETLDVKSDNIPFRGSYVCATINYSTDHLLEKALVIKGQVHEPGNDYIDMHYLQIGEKLIFDVAKEVEGFGSREYGKRARIKVDNILIDKTNAIVFDFSGVSLVSSSFADEVFGKLFVELGALEFMRRCEFRSIDSTVKRLIDRAISQRVRSD
jgi:anti-anti-sigma regulatory factor